MLSKILTLLIILLAVIIQISFLPVFFGHRAAPDLVLVLTAFWTARIGFNRTWRWALGAGFLLDLASFLRVGINIFSFALSAYISSWLARRFLVTRQGWRFLVLACIIIVITISNFFSVKLLFETFQGAGLSFSAAFSRIALADLLLKIFYNVILLVLIYWPVRKLERLTVFEGGNLNAIKQ